MIPSTYWTTVSYIVSSYGPNNPCDVSSGIAPVVEDKDRKKPVRGGIPSQTQLSFTRKPEILYLLPASFWIGKKNPTSVKQSLVLGLLSDFPVMLSFQRILSHFDAVQKLYKLGKWALKINAYILGFHKIESIAVSQIVPMSASGSVSMWGGEGKSWHRPKIHKRKTSAFQFGSDQGIGGARA